jgi:hypothetical protein
MTTLACIAAASLLLGMFFNSYAMIAVCAIAAIANLASIPTVGFLSASTSLIIDLVAIQVAYLAGLLASALLPVAKPASVPTTRP